MSNGVYYRGEAVDYGPTACCPSLMRQSWFSLTQENHYYQQIINQFSDTALFKSMKKDAEYKELDFFKMLGLLQHYGFGTRLLDISRNEQVAEYFASCDHFDKSGAVYEFDDKTIKNIKTINNRIKSINRKMKCILDAQELQHKDILDELGIEKSVRGTITKNVIIDYETLYKSIFGSTRDNVRLNRQAGAFILTGVSLDDKNRIDNRRFIIEPDFKRVVDAKDKIGTLTTLLLQDEPITYVNLFPDSYNSVCLLNEFYLLACEYETDEPSALGKLQEKIQNLLSNTTEIIENNVLKRIIEDKNIYCFIFIEFRKYLEFLEESGTARCEAFKMFARRIMKKE